MNDELKWYFQLPRERLFDLRRRFGREDELDPAPSGHAIWKQDTLDRRGWWPIVRIELRDEKIPHSKPAMHHDFLYFWFDGSATIPHLTPQQLLRIFSISKSIMIDRLANRYIVRCHFSGANMATMLLILEVFRLSSTQLEGLDQSSLDNRYAEYIMQGEVRELKYFDKIRRLISMILSRQNSIRLN